MVQEDSNISIDTYTLAIENLANKKDSGVFENQGARNASIVLGNIFRTAMYSIKLFVTSLDNEIYGSDYFTANLKVYLERNTDFFILFKNEPEKNSIALQQILQYKQTYDGHNIKLYKLNEGFDSISGFNPFIIADRRMFRMETDVVAIKAYCSFNNESITLKMEDIFDSLLKISTEKPLTLQGNEFK